MWNTRPNRYDLDLWAEMGNYGWDYDSVLPFMLKYEDQGNPNYVHNGFHATGGPLHVEDRTYQTPSLSAFINAGIELGYKYIPDNSFTQTGFTIPQLFVKDGIRQSSATAFLKPVIQRKNLHVSLESTVVKILLDEYNRAVGVLYRRSGELRKVFATKEVVLSAGAVESPKLLLLSGIGPSKHLAHVRIKPRVQLDGVGKNLHDHLAIHHLLWTVDKGNALGLSRVLDPKEIIKYRFKKSGYIANNHAISGTGFMKSSVAEPHLDWPDMRIGFASAQSAFLYGYFMRNFLNFGDEAINHFSSLYLSDGVAIVPILLRSRSRGYLRLDHVRPEGHPIINPRYLTDPYDVKVLQDGIRLALLLGNSRSFAKIGGKMFPDPLPACNHHVPWSDSHTECLVRHTATTVHGIAGTCKMGPPGDHYAVVDPELRVYGVSGLRVVDASVFPTPTAGLLATVYMMAERAAYLIKKDWTY